MSFLSYTVGVFGYICTRTKHDTNFSNVVAVMACNIDAGAICGTI